MRRFTLLALTVSGLASAVAAAPAAATVVELGPTPKTPLTPPTCPPGVTAANCTIILTQVTAMETIRGGVAYPTTVKKAGYLVAFTLGLSRLDSNFSNATTAVHYLNSTYGGPPQASITVLKPAGTARKRSWKVAAESPVVHLQPYLGQVAQFPLQTPLPVAPKDVIALTVPTWAPVLTFDQPLKSFAYRQSRTHNCANPPASTQAQTTIGQTARYLCNYPGTRVEYSATEVTSAVPDKQQIH